MAVKEITKENLNSEVVEFKGKVLVEFWAPWCNACRIISASMDQLSNEVGDGVNITKVNIGEETDIAEKYTVQSTPTILILENNTEIFRHIGVMPLQVLKDLLTK